MGQAITVEELQIVISAQVKDALQGIQQVMTKLQQMMNVKMPDLQRQMQSITVPMQQASAQVRKTTEQSSEAVRKSTEGSKKSLESLYAQLGQLNARLENQRKIYDGLVEKSRSISFKHGDNSLESARIEKSLLTAAETYDRLKAKSDAVRAAIAKLKEPFEQAALAANKCAVSTEKVTGAMAGSDPALNKSEQVIRRVQESMENLAKSTEKYKDIGKSSVLSVNNISSGFAETNAPAEQIGKTLQRIKGTVEQAGRSIEKYGTVEKAVVNKVAGAFEQAAAAADKYTTATEKVAGAVTGATAPLNNSEQVIRRVQESMENLAKSTEKYKNIGKLPINDFSGGLAEANAPADQVDKTIQRVRDGTEQARKSTEKYGKAAKSAASKAAGAFEKLGKVIKNALIIGVFYKSFRSLFKFISDGIKAAISAPEIENMFNVAFGSMAYQADQFALRLKKAFGVDQIAVKQMLGTFQNFNDSMGIGAQTAYKMSTTLTQLAYDMASLYEMDVNQVYENLQSGLQGMPRALYKYGIAITDANIRQTALRYGIGETGRELTSQEKIIARYITILEQTKNAQGDMARTIESPANQLRILKSQLTAAGRAIGQAFMPFIQAVLPFLNALAVVLERVGNALARFTFRLFGRDFDAEMKEKQEALKNLGDSTGSVAGAQEDLADGINDAKKAAKGALAPFDELTVLQKDMADASVPDMSGGAYEFPDLPTLEPPEGESPYEKMADRILAKFTEIFNEIRTFWDKYFAEPFAQAWAKISPQIEKLKDTFGKIFADILTLAQPLTDWFYNNAIPMLQQLVITGGDVLAGLLDSINMVILDIWNALFPMIQAFIELALPAITDFVTESIKTFETLFDEIKKIFDLIWMGAIKPALDLISQIWQDLMQDIKDLWDKWGVTTFENIRETIRTTSGLFQKTWETVLKPIFDKIFQVLGELWTEHLNPLLVKIGDFVMTLANAAMDIYNQFIAPIVGWFIETLGPAISETVNLIIEVIGGLLGTIADIAGSILDVLGGIIEFIAGVFTGDWDRAWNGIKDIFTGIWDGIVSFFSGIWETLTGLFDTLMESAKNAADRVLEFIGLKEKTKEAADEVGEAITTGTEEGIKKNSNKPQSAAVDMMDQSIKGAKEKAGIHSPSTVFAEIGENLILGLAEGIRNGTSTALSSIQELVNGLRDALQAAFSTMDSMGGEGVEVGIMPGQGGMFYQFGMQLMQGLSAGITAGQVLVTQAIVAAADTIKTDFKTQFEIEELSGVFTEYGQTFAESLATGITDNTEFVLEALQGLAETIDEHYAEFMEEFSGTFTEDMDELYETLSDTVSSMEESVTDATSQMINSISRLISRIEKAIDRLLELYDLGGSFGGGSGRDKDKSKTSGSGGRSISGLTLDIPQLAKGAVLRRPTIVNVAEYAGAMSNPEIVSPRNIMYDTVVEANAPLVSAMSQIANRIITAIEENQPITEIGDDIIYASAKRGARKYKRMIGSII